MSADEQKRACGEAAAALVRDGMILGLGTGSTAAFFVAAVGARAKAEGMTLRCVATSRVTEAQAAAAGLDLLDLDAAGELDLVVDGADEVGPGLALIKGGGAALLREKLVWEAARRRVVIADTAKRVARLGKFSLPVEVVAFGHVTTAKRIAALLAQQSLSGEPVLRDGPDGPRATDGGNLIYDLPLGAIPDPAALAHGLKAITGVVEHGLFIGLAHEALIGTDAGVVRLAAAAASA